MTVTMTTDVPAHSSSPIEFRPFCYGRRQRDMAQAIENRLAEAIDSRRRGIVSDRNKHSFRHGQEWSFSYQAEAPEFSSFKSATAMAQIPFDEIIDHRLSTIPAYINRLATEFERQMFSSIIALMNDTTERTGNVVSHSGNAAEDFLAMLQKVETGCDRYGRPTMPTLLTGPGAGKKILDELERQPHEFQRTIEDLKAEKEKSATAQEANRISRFRWRPCA